MLIFKTFRAWSHKLCFTWFGFIKRGYNNVYLRSHVKIDIVWSRRWQRFTALYAEFHVTIKMTEQCQNTLGGSLDIFPSIYMYGLKLRERRLHTSSAWQEWLTKDYLNSVLYVHIRLLSLIPNIILHRPTYK